MKIPEDFLIIYPDKMNYCRFGGLQNPFSHATVLILLGCLCSHCQ